MSLVELLSRRLVSCFSSHSDVYNVCLNASTTPIMAMGCQQCLPLIIEKQWDKAKNTAMLCEDQFHFGILIQCIALLFRDTIAKKKNLAKTVLPIFSTVRHSISVFLLYYTILYYNGKRMCTMSRTYAAQLRAPSYFWGVAAVGNDGSERLSFWLSNIQASVLLPT